MSRSLSPKVLRELVGYLEETEAPGGFNRQYLLAAVRLALAPKKSAAPAKKRRTSKKVEQRAEWEAIREKVLKRAGGACEHCGHRTDLEVDHVFGGSGRRRTLQSIYSCMALCHADHAAKTRNAPSPAYWLGAFVGHAARLSRLYVIGGRQDIANGYDAASDIASARLQSLQIQGRAG